MAAMTDTKHTHTPLELRYAAANDARRRGDHATYNRMTSEITAINFQEASANAYAYCQKAAINDRYIPRVRHHQQNAADLSRHARAALAKAQEV